MGQSRTVRRWAMAIGLVAAVASVVGFGAPVASRPGGATRTAAPASVRSVDDQVHLNQIQVVGSHNSYKRMVSDKEEALRRSVIHGAADLMQYQHEPLAECVALVERLGLWLLLAV